VIAEQRGLPGSDVPLRVLWGGKGLDARGAARRVEQRARFPDRTPVEPAAAYLLVEESALVESLENAGCEPVAFLGTRSSWDPRRTRRLRPRPPREDVDVIHIHSPLVAIGSRLAIRTLPRRKRPRTVVTEPKVGGSHAVLTRAARLTTPGPCPRSAISTWPSVTSSCCE
jgi:hypothetical protein